MALSLRKISASNEHLPRLSGTARIAHRFAENVTSRSLVSNAMSVRSASSGLPSSTSVTKPTHPDRTSHAESVNALFANRRFSKDPQFARLEGNRSSRLSSTSSTLSWLSSPMDSGSVLSALPDRMSVLKPERREMSCGTNVIPSEIFKVFVAVAHQVAGSTSSPLGNSSKAPSRVSSLASESIAFFTSSHTGFGRCFSNTAAAIASASAAARRAASCAACSSPAPPRRSFASSSFFLRFERCVAVSPSGASGSTASSSSSVSSSLDSPPRLMRAASASCPAFAAYSAAVLPRSHLSRKLHPASRSSWQASAWPCAAAIISAVRPSPAPSFRSICSRSRVLRVWSTSMRSTLCRLPAAAIMMEVYPSSSRTDGDWPPAPRLHRTVSSFCLRTDSRNFSRLLPPLFDMVPSSRRGARTDKRASKRAPPTFVSSLFSEWSERILRNSFQTVCALRAFICTCA